jgi:hypothetical protein
MSWVKKHELHRCALPDYDKSDPHRVGEYWLCDEIRCNQLWYIATMGISNYLIDGVEHREPFYAWQRTTSSRY